VSDIFISYASQDRVRIRPLVEALEARGWSVFWDTTLLPGETWRRKITAELDAAGCVIVLWSERSVESHWVEQEAEEGQRRRILVPAMIDRVTIPLGFRSLQAANLVGWDGKAGHGELEKILRAVGIQRHGLQCLRRFALLPLRQQHAGQVQLSGRVSRLQLNGSPEGSGGGIQGAQFYLAHTHQVVSFGNLWVIREEPGEHLLRGREIARADSL